MRARKSSKGLEPESSGPLKPLFMRALPVAPRTRRVVLVESPSHTNVVGGFNAPTRNGLLDARRSRRATRTSASDQRRTAISEVVFPGPAANCPVWGKIGAIAD